MDSGNVKFDPTWSATLSAPSAWAIAGADVTIVDSTGLSSKVLPSTDKFGRTAPFLAYAGDWIYVAKAGFISPAYFQIPEDPEKINDDRLIARVYLKPIPEKIYPIKILTPASGK